MNRFAGISDPIQVQAMGVWRENQTLRGKWRALEDSNL